MTNLEIANIILFFSSSIAAFAGGSHHRHVRKRGFIAGLLGQPFWFYTSWVSGNMGIFYLSFMYTAFHIRGYRNNR